MTGRHSTAQPSIDDLREEFAQNHLHGWLWSWLAKNLEAFVRFRIAPRYRASVYSPSGKWDPEGITDLVTDFIVDRGIRGGAIIAALQRAGNSSGVTAYLERALKNFVVSQRARTVAHNVYSRLVEALDDDPELQCLAGIGGRKAYGLVEWADDPPPQYSQDLSGAAKYIPADVKVFEYTTGDRQSPGLLTNDLRAIAQEVIRGSGRLLTASQIMSVIEHRFELYRSEVELDPESWTALADRRLDPLEETVAKELAYRFIECLTGRQRDVFRELIRADSSTVRSVASQLGISKSVVQREQKALGEILLRLQVTGHEEQAQVIAAAGALVSHPRPDLAS